MGQVSDSYFIQQALTLLGLGRPSHVETSTVEVLDDAGKKVFAEFILEAIGEREVPVHASRGALNSIFPPSIFDETRTVFIKYDDKITAFCVVRYPNNSRTLKGIFYSNFYREQKHILFDILNKIEDQEKASLSELSFGAYLTNQNR